MQVHYPNLFQEGKIGKLTLRNRLVMPPMGTNLAQEDGHVTDTQIRYYEERAQGGVGMVIVEIAGVDPGGRAIPRQIGLWDDKFIPGLSKLASAIKKAGAVAAIQLHHAGRQTNSTITGSQPVAPSPIPCPVNQETPRELTIEEINKLVNAFGEAARRAYVAGFDLVELHGTHGYLINQFLSPYSNHRQDEYGGPFENRLRFALEVIQAVKENTALDFPVSFRMNGDEYVEGGIKLEEAKEMAKRFIDAGVHVLHVSAGVYGSPAPNVPVMGTPPAPLLHLAEGIKSVSSVPVIAVAKIHQPDLADSIIKEGKADFVSIGRGLICDPEWTKKAQEGKVDDIRGCITCNQGCIDRLLAEAGSVSCIYNARAGRELQFPMTEVEAKKKVVIIGGGPAGMEAARTAVLRGHTVHLFEEAGELGGQALLASATPHKDEFGEVVRFYRHEMGRLKVNLHLGTRADAVKVKQLNPDTVIIATGAQPLVPDIPGADRPNVVQAWDVISGKVTPSGKVAVIGGGLVGCETAELLAEKGCEIVMFEMLEDIATDIGPSLRTVLLERLMNNPKIKIITGAEVKEICENSIVLVKEEGRQAVQGIDTVVLAVGSTPRDEVVEEIRATGIPVHVIGDVKAPRKAIDAIHEAFETAYAL